MEALGDKVGNARSVDKAFSFRRFNVEPREFDPGAPVTVEIARHWRGLSEL